MSLFKLILITIVSSITIDLIASSGGKESIVDLETYVVTGTKTLHRLHDAPIRTEVFSNLDMEIAATRTFANAIELVPGVRIENNCQNCGTSDILLLGLEGKYTSLLVDGLPLYSGLANVYGIDQIPSIFIDRIEVVKGAGSSVYGGGAVGGVVNIIARNPQESGGKIDYRFDSIKGMASYQVSAIADYVSHSNSNALSIYAQKSESDPVDLNNDGLSDLTMKEQEVWGLRWMYDIGEHTLQLNYNHTNEFRRGGDHFDLPDHLANISERIDTIRNAGNVSFFGNLYPELSFQINAGAAIIDRETFYGGLFGNHPNDSLIPESQLQLGDNDQAFIDRGYRNYGEVAIDQYGFTKNWVYSLDASIDYDWNAHVTSLGIQYFYEKIDDMVPVSDFVKEFPAQTDSSDGSSIGIFVQDDWHFADDWELLLGLRMDNNSELDDPIVSPRLSLRYRPDNNLTVRATFGTGFRAPQPFDEDLHIERIAGERATTRQSENLKEEESYSALLSVVWNPEATEGKLTVESNLFYTSLKDTFAHSEIKWDAIDGEHYRERFNGPDAEIGGMELNIGMLPIPQLRIDLGWISQFARFEDAITLVENDDGSTIRERDFLETPTNYGVLQLTYYNEEQLDVSFSAIYTGAMKDINERTGILNEKTQDFWVFNLSVMRGVKLENFPEIRLSAGVKNLTDDRQKDLEFGVDRDPYYLYGPRTPRTYFLQVGFDF